MLRMVILSVIAGVLVSVLDYTNIALGWVFFIGYFCALVFAVDAINWSYSEAAKRKGGAK